MEARKVTLVLTGSNSKKTIMSKAETLGELKEDMRTAGISISDANIRDMDFHEGRTRVILNDDSAILPKDILVRGRNGEENTITNDLVFMVTTAKSKIKSGALSPKRKEILDFIKEHNLGAEVVKEFGKNSTQVKTENLEVFVNEYIRASKLAEVAEVKEETEVKEVIEKEEVAEGEVQEKLVKDTTDKYCMGNGLAHQVTLGLLSLLEEMLPFTCDDLRVEAYLGCIKRAVSAHFLNEKCEPLDPPSDKEIDEMFHWVKK